MIVITCISDTMSYVNGEPGCLASFDVLKSFDKRFAKKRDKSVLYALKAMENLTTQCHFDSLNLDETGIFLSNIYGGWDYVEQQLADLYNQGLDIINPYVATAWFATAAQGEISIKYNIKGYSKTICAGNLGGGIALKHSCERLSDKKIQHAVVGAVEAPNTKLLHRVINNPILVDGSILFLLENEETAVRNNCDVKIKILDIQVSKGASLNLLNAANEKKAVIIDVKMKNNKALITDNQENKIAGKLSKIELFSLEIPYLIKTLYENYKGCNQDILLNCSDDRQTCCIFMNIV